MVDYSDCVYCGGAVEEQKVRLDYRYHGQLYLIENLPVGVCVQCGEKFLTAETAKRIEVSLGAGPEPAAMVLVPVLRF